MKTDLSRINHNIRNGGIKKSFVAKKIGISEPYLSLILNGKRPLPGKVKEDLFNLLKIEA